MGRLPMQYRDLWRRSAATTIESERVRWRAEARTMLRAHIERESSRHLAAQVRQWRGVADLKPLREVHAPRVEAADGTVRTESSSAASGRGSRAALQLFWPQVELR